MHGGGLGERLTPKERDCLRFLAERADHVVSRDELMEGVWGFDGGADNRRVFSTIRRLRTKIEPDPANPRYLISEYGDGYRLFSSPLSDLVSEAQGSRLAPLAVFACPFTLAEASAILPDREALEAELQSLFGAPAPSNRGPMFPALPEAERAALLKAMPSSTKKRAWKAWEQLREGQMLRDLEVSDVAAVRDRRIEIEPDLRALAERGAPAAAVLAVEALRGVGFHKGRTDLLPLLISVADRTTGAYALRALLVAIASARSEPEQALGLVSRAEVLAKRLGTAHQRRELALNAAKVLISLNRCEEAERLVEPWARGADAGREVLYMYAWILVHSGRSQDALPWAWAALAAAENTRQSVGYTRTLVSSALASAGDAEAAYVQARLAHQECELEASPYLRYVAALRWMMAAAGLGRWPEAEALLRENRRRIELPAAMELMNMDEALMLAARGRWMALRELLAATRDSLSGRENGVPLLFIEGVSEFATGQKGPAWVQLPSAGAVSSGWGRACGWLNAIGALFWKERAVPPSRPPADASLVALSQLFEALKTGASPPETMDLVALSVTNAVLAATQKK